jgi:hypothetical protein
MSIRKLGIILRLEGLEETLHLLQLSQCCVDFALVHHDVRHGDPVTARDVDVIAVGVKVNLNQ